MGFHLFSDILCGAAIGVLMVLASQILPTPRLAFKALDLQRKWPVVFCVAMFIAMYSLATFAGDIREIASKIAHHRSEAYFRG